MITHNELAPLWQETCGKAPDFPALRRDLEVEVAIVGAGITGLTTAYYLARAGLSIAVLAAGRVGGGESGRSHGQLGSVPDLQPAELIRRFDLDTAAALCEGMGLAIDRVQEILETTGIACDFRRVPGYVLAFDEVQAELLRSFAHASWEMGHALLALAPEALPFPFRAGLLLERQAHLNPLRYLHGLAGWLQGMGVPIFEDSHVDRVIEGQPTQVEMGTGEIVRAAHVVFASHVPLNRLTLHAKIAAYRAYSIACLVPPGRFPDAVVRDLAEPSHTFSATPLHRQKALIVSGGGHKTGQLDGDEPPFASLVDYARSKLGVDAEVAYRWSSQVIKPCDGLPLVGQNPGTEREWVATGFGGAELTLGTLAGHMLAERLLGRTTIWDARFDPGRLALHGMRAAARENADYPAYLVKDRIAAATTDPPARLKPGEGGLFWLGGRRVAVARLDDGRLATLSPVCTHLGCLVHYNALERTWDCPCHGSRFSREGGVLNGPAVRPLAAIPLVPEADAEPALLPSGVEPLLT